MADRFLRVAAGSTPRRPSLPVREEGHPPVGEAAIRCGFARPRWSCRSRRRCGCERPIPASRPFAAGGPERRGHRWATRSRRRCCFRGREPGAPFRVPTRSSRATRSSSPGPRSTVPLPCRASPHPAAPLDWNDLDRNRTGIEPGCRRTGTDAICTCGATGSHKEPTVSVNLPVDHTVSTAGCDDRAAVRISMPRCRHAPSLLSERPSLFL